MLDRIQTGRIARPMRNVIYGVEGIGKSTLAAQFPNPVTLAAEDGTSHLDTARFVPNDYADALAFIDYLWSTPDHGFLTLNIDTAGWSEEMAAASVCRNHNVKSLEDIGYGKWKRLLFEEFNMLLAGCTALYAQGMHINFIAHTDIKKFSNPEGEDFDRFNVQMNRPELADRLKQWADNIMFMNYDLMFKEEQKGMATTKEAKSLGRRLLFCKRTAAFDAKTRFNLPDRIDLGEDPAQAFAKFDAHYTAWVTSALSAQPTQTEG